MYIHTIYIVLWVMVPRCSKNGTTFNTFPAGCTVLFPPQPSEALRCMAFVCWPPVLLAFWLVPNVKYVKSPKWHVTSRITAPSSATPSRRHRVWRSLEKDTISRFWKTGQFWRKMVCIFCERLVNTSEKRVWNKFPSNKSAEFRILCSLMPLLWQDAYVDLEFLNDVGSWVKL